jgi:hypothetical protein
MQRSVVRQRRYTAEIKLQKFRMDMKKNIIKNAIMEKEIMMMTITKMITIIEGEEREEDS